MAIATFVASSSESGVLSLAHADNARSKALRMRATAASARPPGKMVRPISDRAFRKWCDPLPTAASKNSPTYFRERAFLSKMVRPISDRGFEMRPISDRGFEK
jgi:hypothetical protein